MAGFTPYSGRFKTMWFPKAASEAFAINDLVYFNGSGYLTKADATSGDHIGTIQKTVTSSDSDYASNTFVPVLVPRGPHALWKVPVGTGTLTSAMVGNTYDLKDANEIDVNAQSKNVVTIAKYISGTEAVVIINAMAAHQRVATT